MGLTLKAKKESWGRILYILADILVPGGLILFTISKVGGEPALYGDIGIVCILLGIVSALVSNKLLFRKNK